MARKNNTRKARRTLQLSQFSRPMRLPTALIGTVALVSARAGLGADATDTSADQTTQQQGSEITVVGRRLRPESQTSATGLDMHLVDTPQAVSVVTPEMMQVAGASDIYEAANTVPGLNPVGRGYGLDRLVLRGIDVSELRVNGAPFTPLHTLDQFAMERTEVVRGPATALYGVSGNFGGEINNILKEPGQTFHGELGYENGSIALKQYEADVGGPVPGTDDRLSVRLLGDYREYGAPEDVVPIRNDRTMFMGSVKYQFSDTTVAHAWFYYSRLSEDPYDGGFTQRLPNGTLVLPNVSPDHWYYGDPRYDQNRVNESFAIADVRHDFNENLYFKAQFETDRIGRTISEYFPFGPAGAYSLPLNQVYYYSYDQREQTKELCFDASLGGKFMWLGREQQFLTAFEYQGTIDPFQNILLNSVFLGTINIYDGGKGILADGTPVPLINRNDLHISSDRLQSYDNYRGSVQFLLSPFERWQTLLGVMYQRSTIDSTIPIQGSKVLTPATVQNETYDKAVPRAAVTYTVMSNKGAIDDVKAYFNYSQGFQPNIGSFDKNGNPLTTPQLMTAYEAGLKGEFLNHALGSSLAVYDEKITEIPVRENVQGGFGNPVSILEGAQKVKGVEWELIGQLFPGFNLATNYAYTQAVVTDPNYDFTIPVAEVPKHEGAIYATYEFLGGPVRGLRVGVSDVIRSKFTFVPSLVEVQRFGQYTHGGYSVVGVNLSYVIESGKARGLEIFANGNNILNKIIYLEKEDQPGFAITREDPLQYIVGVRYKF